MTIGCLGVDHTHAPLALRERLAVSGERLDTLLDHLRADARVAEAAVLCTCNRTEIYIVSSEMQPALSQVALYLSDVTGVPLPRVAGVMESYLDRAAIQHLFAVAAGLCSLAIGETQIVTQVREAFAYAAERDAGGPTLGALARAAVTCGKRVRAETAIGAADTSVSALAVQMVRQRLGPLEGRAALLIGAGRINAVSARLLRDAGVSALTIASRSHEGAARLAADHGARAATFDGLPALLAEADLVITAARAPYAIVLPDMIPRRPPGRPLLVVDIAVPRNVDAAVGALPRVEVVDLDGMSSYGGTRDAIAAAWEVVEACVDRYLVDARTQRAVPLIAALRAHVDGQKEAELARTLATLSHLPSDDRDAVELLAHRLVNRMFHHLAMRLKAVAAEPNGDAYLEALAFLFEHPEAGSAEAALQAKVGREDRSSDGAGATPTLLPAETR